MCHARNTGVKAVHRCSVVSARLPGEPGALAEVARVMTRS
jgi:hypothetical protein